MRGTGIPRISTARAIRDSPGVRHRLNRTNTTVGGDDASNRSACGRVRTRGRRPGGHRMLGMPTPVDRTRRHRGSLLHRHGGDRTARPRLRVLRSEARLSKKLAGQQSRKDIRHHRHDTDRQHAEQRPVQPPARPADDQCHGRPAERHGRPARRRLRSLVPRARVRRVTGRRRRPRARLRSGHRARVPAGPGPPPAGRDPGPPLAPAPRGLSYPATSGSAAANSHAENSGPRSTSVCRAATAMKSSVVAVACR